MIQHISHNQLVQIQLQLNVYISFLLGTLPYYIAESFGAKGLRVTNQEELEAALKEGYATEGPVLI
jgi:UDP-N-acetylmuramyl pentapeptide synthase